MNPRQRWKIERIDLMQNRIIRLSEHERATTRKTSIKSREIRYVMSRIGAFTPPPPRTGGRATASIPPSMLTGVKPAGPYWDSDKSLGALRASAGLA